MGFQSAFEPWRRVAYLYAAASAVFAWTTFSDDWHAIVNDGTATTALSVAAGILVAATLIIATHSRR